MLAPADRRNLPPLLKQISQSVEELLLTGLTTASDATRQVLDVTFREASRMRLLRLGSTLRAANEELARFVNKRTDFSAKRLAFFLNRAWMLSRGLQRALDSDDEEEFQRLIWTPASRPVDRLELITLGVSKKEVAGNYCAFEFRLRTLSDTGDIPRGQRLLWSCIFPLKSGTKIPAEGFLHLPQKQKFKANLFLGRTRIHIENAAVALDGHGGGRISLLDKSTVAAGDPVNSEDWQPFLQWNMQAAIARIRDHQTSPFDLEVELQEEVVVRDWILEKAGDARGDDQVVYPLRTPQLELDAVVSTSSEGRALKKNMQSLLKKKRERPPLFGLMHYQMCRLVFQPLTLFDDKNPLDLMISQDKVDRGALLKSLDFS